MKGKTHDLNHDLISYAHTINCVCHSIRSMFRVLGVYNFDKAQQVQKYALNSQLQALQILTNDDEVES